MYPHLTNDDIVADLKDEVAICNAWQTVIALAGPLYIFVDLVIRKSKEAVLVTRLVNTLKACQTNLKINIILSVSSGADYAKSNDSGSLCTGIPELLQHFHPIMITTGFNND